MGHGLGSGDGFWYGVLRVLGQVIPLYQDFILRSVYLIIIHLKSSILSHTLSD